jgi:hypothetical protein
MVHLIRTSWTGTSGGLGLTQFAIDTADASFGPLGTGDAQDAVNAARTFWDAIKANMPNEVSFVVSPVVDYYLTSDASLSGSVSAPTPPVAVLGTGTASYSMAAGLKLNWNTTTIRNGRRVRGSTFLVPTTSSAFNQTGTADTTVRTAINTAAAAYLNALSATGLKGVVWSRPLDEDDPNGPRDGATADITGVEVSEKTAILRGRRD